MGRRTWIIGGILAALLLARVGADTARAADRILVAASIAPLADFARQVGGDRVEVITLVPPGASPHTYELKPSQVRQVAGARLLILNGAGLEYWAEKLVRAAGKPALEVVDTSRGIPYRPWTQAPTAPTRIPGWMSGRPCGRSSTSGTPWSGWIQGTPRLTVRTRPDTSPSLKGSTGRLLPRSRDGGAGSSSPSIPPGSTSAVRWDRRHGAGLIGCSGVQPALAPPVAWSPKSRCR